MALKSLLSKSTFIRLSDDQTAFLCTVKYGRLFSRTTRIPLESEPELAPEETIVRQNRRPENLLGLSD